MGPVDLERPATVSLRPQGGTGQNIAVFAGTFGRALMVVAALPFPLRDRARIDVHDSAEEEGSGQLAA
jgi:hypothetical protein